MHDPAVSCCSAEARGLWIDMICVMHLNDTYEVKGTLNALSRMLRSTPDEVSRGLLELAQNDVAEVTVDGEPCNALVTLCNAFVMVKSRRRYRQCNAKEKTRKRVENWRLRNKNAPVTPKVTPKVTGQKRGIFHISEYISKESTKEKGRYNSQVFGEKFRSQWLAWVGVRLKLKKPVEWESYFDGIFKKLHEFDEAHAIYLLEFSTTNQYQGIIWDRKFPGQQTQTGNGRRESAWSVKERMEAAKQTMDDFKEKHYRFVNEPGIREYRWDSLDSHERYMEMRRNFKRLREELAHAGD